MSLFRSGFASPEEVKTHAARMVAARKSLVAQTSGLGLVLVVHGANENVLEVGGQTVCIIRRELGGLFNISLDAEALVGDHPVGEDYAMRHGETLEFLVPLGRKGV